MKHKGIYRIVPFLLAVLLISSGLVLPRLMIKRLKTQLLQVSGNVRAESLALYGYDEINAQVLAGRMKGLSEMTALLAAGEDTSDALLIDTREPLDTELTQENAISAAQSFLSDMQTVFAEYGYSFFDDSSADAARSTEKAAAEYAYSGASLLLSSSDASLSLWRIGLGNYEVILDAVTGTPVYLCGDISHAGIPLTKCEPYDLFWKAAAGAYNSRYMLGIDLYPRQMEVNEEPGTAGRIHTWKGQGEHCYLKVEFLQDEKKYTPFFSIRLYE